MTERQTDIKEGANAPDFSQYQMKPGMTPQRLDELFRNFSRQAEEDPDMAAFAVDNFLPEEMNKNALYIAIAQGYARKAQGARGEKGETERSQRYMELSDFYWGKTEIGKTGESASQTSLRPLPRGIDVLMEEISRQKDPYVSLFLAENLIPEKAKRDALYAGLVAAFSHLAEEAQRNGGINSPTSQLHQRMAEYCKSKSAYFSGQG